MKFAGITIEFRIPDYSAGLDFYTRLFGRAPDFEPNDSAAEWDISAHRDGDVWFQIAKGDARPSHALRFAVENIDAAADYLEEAVGLSRPVITRIEGLVAVCPFCDPWGHQLGFYQRLFDSTPATPSYVDFELKLKT